MASKIREKENCENNFIEKWTNSTLMKDLKIWEIRENNKKSINKQHKGAIIRIIKVSNPFCTSNAHDSTISQEKEVIRSRYLTGRD